MPPKKKAAEPEATPALDATTSAAEPPPEAKPTDVLELVTCRQKLQRTRQQQRDLQESNRSLRDALAQHKFEQAEIFAYLNKELVQKSKAVAQLEARVGGLEGDMRGQEGEFDQKLMEEKSNARDVTAKLAREVGKYEKELGDLNIFISKKAELEHELEETKTELLKERKKHEQIISELERKTSQEKDRLRRDMENKIREAKETFMKMTDSQLQTTTKKTMQENEQMASELAFQNRETERLLEKNRKLAEENNHTRRQLSMHKEAEGELAKRNHAYLKTIQSLIAKLKAVESIKKDMEKGGKDKEESVIAQYRMRMKLLQDTVEESYEQLEVLRTENEEKHQEVNRLHAIKEDLGMAIIQAAEEAKKSFGGVQGGGSYADHEGDDDDDDDHDPIAGSQSSNVRLTDLTDAQKQKALGYIVSRINELQVVSRGGRQGGANKLPQLTDRGGQQGAKSEQLREERVMAFETRTEYGFK